jgi:hypothetical protein
MFVRDRCGDEEKSGGGEYVPGPGTACESASVVSFLEKRLHVENEHGELIFRNLDVLSMHVVGSYAAGPGAIFSLLCLPLPSFLLSPDIIVHFGFVLYVDNFVKAGPIASVANVMNSAIFFSFRVHHVRSQKCISVPLQLLPMVWLDVDID